MHHVQCNFISILCGIDAYMCIDNFLDVHMCIYTCMHDHTYTQDLDLLSILLMKRLLLHGVREVAQCLLSGTVILHMHRPCIKMYFIQFLFMQIPCTLLYLHVLCATTCRHPLCAGMLRLQRCGRSQEDAAAAVACSSAEDHVLIRFSSTGEWVYNSKVPLFRIENGGSMDAVDTCPMEFHEAAVSWLVVCIALNFLVSL